MFRRTIALFALTCLAGCSNNGNFNPIANGGDSTPEQLAAYAGRSEYPTTQPAKNDLRLATIISRDHNTVKVYNFTNQPISTARLWVNSAYVVRINGIAPHSHVSVPTKDIYNSMGQRFSDTNGGPPTVVQIQTDDSLYNTMGPASE